MRFLSYDRNLRFNTFPKAPVKVFCLYHIAEIGISRFHLSSKVERMHIIQTNKNHFKQHEDKTCMINFLSDILYSFYA